MKLDIVITARLEKKWVHYDRNVLIKGEVHTHRSQADVYHNPLYPSFCASVAPDYILCADKKTLRRKSKGYMNEFAEDLNIEEIIKEDNLNLAYYGGILFYEHQINQKFEINSIRFLNAPYICPKSGVVWQYKDGKEYSDRPWKFKRIPDDIHSFNTTNDQGGLAYTFLNGTSLQKPFIHSVKTSFLSGADAIYEHSRIGSVSIDRYTGEYEDPRDFLINKKPKKINKREKSWLKIKKSCLKRGINVPK
jgi:hypothetical protein